ncbi:MAG: acyl transferase domain-containing protein/3-hydroxymyristoyl [Desulforhopalus sp.]|jgi:acyl transferase domain-containing protein/3-hydroxymyristoyl/3-hydroxydecanoyl-(acyl carrier protein) dehydratase
MENIAVIGIANLFPGSSAPQTFWQQLLNKEDCRSRVTTAEMGVDPASYLGPKGNTDTFYCMHGGYIRDFEFDPSPFAMDPSYLNRLDDLYKWGLYVTQQALGDAGYWGSDTLENCGLILGNLSFPTKSSNHLFLPLYHQVVNNALKQLLSPDFQLAGFSKPESVHPDNALISGYPAALFARAAGLGASSFALDAACASSCYAVKLACDYLHTGKSDMMLAGAVSAGDPLFVNMGFSIFQAFPGNNVHAPFDKKSEGLFAAEGAGMMVLKRHSDAVRDGDKIYAVFKGGALSNDGRGEFVLSPNSKGQVLAYERAYADAEVAPGDVDYIECHATGTPKGDKVELASMETFFSRFNHKPLLGSAKSNLGHLLTAAGMPGMTKAIWAMQEGKIPATIGLQEPISSKDGYFTGEQMPAETVDWPVNNHKQRTAGISVFGFGGSNAHLIMQQATTVPDTKTKPAKAREPLAIIGMDAHFGSACDLRQFKSLIDNRQNHFRELPEKRWRGIETDQSVMSALQLSKAPQGSYIEHFDIDFLRFKVPPNDENCLIPQQLLMMKVADNAAKDAGLQEGANVAVLVAMGIELELHQFRGRVNLVTQIEESLKEQGVSLTAKQQRALTDICKEGIGTAAQLNQYTSFIGNIMASRISALWDFSGPAMTVSSEENSVFRCVELAENLFQTSDVEAVIIASVDLAGSLENLSIRTQYGKVSEKGPDSGGLFEKNEWFVGEGAGAFVVLPQSRAQTGSVYANIDAVGFVSGSDAPALVNAARKTLQLASLNSEDIGQVEAFASGFASENQAEQTAIGQLYAHALVSSVKTTVGNTFNASGVASIIKSALVLDDQQKQSIAINGLGRDGCCAHLIVSATSQPHAAPLLSPAKKPLTLVKSITLGGDSIFQSIINNARATKFTSDVSIDFNEIQQAFAGKLGQVSNPVTLSSVAINQPREQSGPQSQTTITSSQATAEPATAVKTTMTSKASREIYQQSSTHHAFLKTRQAAEKQIAELIKIQVQMISGLPPNTTAPSTAQKAKNHGHCPEVMPTTSGHQSGFQIKGAAGYNYPPLQLTERFGQPSKIIFSEADLVEFAEGDIGKVFGSEYDIIDSYSRRVRLPTSDYLLVSRVTDLDATIHEYKKSSMTTEYDIPIDAPFLIDGQIPWSVSVESGQCDLLLISFIGIDFEAKGERVYRLLDCELTFLEEMTFGGETLRYEIHIDSYARNGEQLLFFFHYDCFVGDKKILIMRNGCAGFFTDEELADGKGVIHNDKDKAQFASAKKSFFKPLIENNRTEYGYDSMMKLVNGDIAGCFGPKYDQQGRNPSLKFSSEKFLMIERITKIDQRGGRWGLGLLEGQKTLDPEHWYFPCHFKGDQVMAGSLMSEGCGQMAMFFMLWLGMNCNVNNARFQPMPGESQTVRCRGQVIPQHNTLTYRMEVTEIGMSPQPFVKANIDIILDGKVVVDFKNLCVMISEQDENSPYSVKLPDNVVRLQAQAQAVAAATDVMPEGGALSYLTTGVTGRNPFQHPERPLMRIESDTTAPKEKGVTPILHFEAPEVEGQNRVANTVPFTPWHLFEFATGDIAKCFGSDFDVYEGRIPPRTPCGDLQLVTRVVKVQGERLELKTPSRCTAEYYVPEDAWYFTKNTHENWIPYSLIMEIALQPNGFLSGYMGTTLKYPEKDLFFRNLDGTAELLKKIDLRGKTIVNKSVLTNTSIAGGAIIQSFTFDLSVDGECFYKGSAVFGYFSADSLTNQLGLDNGNIVHPWFIENNTPVEQIERFDLTNKQLPFFQAPATRQHYRLAGGQMNFVDTVSIVEGGGKAGIAYILGERTIDATDWFFRYHFHQDPVMPGSLGVEAIIELLQVYALKNDLGAGLTNPRFVAPLTKVVWKYRGQITPLNEQMSLDVHITDIKKEKGEIVLVGDANLAKDGLRIYEVKNIVLSIVEA